MTNVIETHLNTQDGLRLYVKKWLVEAPKAVVMLVHGINEHIGRYEHVAQTLNAAGYSVVGLDHRTHGKSEGQPRVLVQDIDTFVDDLALLWEQIKQENVDLPRFVVGHSMGGLIAVRFTLRYQDEMQGLVTSGPAMIVGDNFPAPVVSLLSVLANLMPSVPLVPALPTSALSHDPKVIAAFDKDELCYHGNTRLGMAKALLMGSADTLSQAHTLTLPMLMMHGEADELVTVQASRELAYTVASLDKTLKIYPDLRHEIFNEYEKEGILAEVVAWLDAHLPT